MKTSRGRKVANSLSMIVLLYMHCAFIVYILQRTGHAHNFIPIQKVRILKTGLEFYNEIVGFLGSPEEQISYTSYSYISFAIVSLSASIESILI